MVLDAGLIDTFGIRGKGEVLLDPPRSGVTGTLLEGRRLVLKVRPVTDGDAMIAGDYPLKLEHQPFKLATTFPGQGYQCTQSFLGNRAHIFNQFQERRMSSGWCAVVHHRHSVSWWSQPRFGRAAQHSSACRVCLATRASSRNYRYSYEGWENDAIARKGGKQYEVFLESMIEVEIGSSLLGRTNFWPYYTSELQHLQGDRMFCMMYNFS